MILITVILFFLNYIEYRSCYKKENTKTRTKTLRKELLYIKYGYNGVDRESLANRQASYFLFINDKTT